MLRNAGPHPPYDRMLPTAPARGHRPVDVPTRSYELPPGVDGASLVASLAERVPFDTDRHLTQQSRRSAGAYLYRLEQDEPTTARVTVLDTADRRLRDAALDLRLEVGSGRSTLVLRTGVGDPPLRTDVPPTEAYLTGDLPPGPLRDRLAPVLDMRALLPLARMSEDVRPVRVLDREGKTVVRIAVAERTVLPPDGGAVRLPARVDAAGVLGYDRALERVDRVLAGDLALGPAAGPVADAAIAAAGGDPGGIRTKVRVDLRPDQRTDEAARAVLTDLAGMVEANLPGTLDDLDTEFLHDSRVAVRKSRSVLREMRRAFPPAPLADQRDALRWVQAITGDVRDLDVQLLEWDALATGLSDERRAALAPVEALLAAHRSRAFEVMRRELTGDAYGRAWAAYRSFLADGSSGNHAPDAERPDAARPVAAVAGRRIRSVYRRMREMGEAIDGTSPATALHDLRKRGKELRYLLELFGGLWPPDVVRPMVKTLKGLQDVLGTHQDREVQADHLRSLAPDLAPQPGGPQALLALGALVDRLEGEQHAARAAFAARFAAFAARDQRTLVEATFRGGA